MCLAIPGRIVSCSAGVDPLFRFGVVDFGGVARNINLSMVPEAAPDDYVLVHVGVALQVIDEWEATDMMESLQQAGALSKALETPDDPIESP